MSRGIDSLAVSSGTSEKLGFFGKAGLLNASGLEPLKPLWAAWLILVAGLLLSAGAGIATAPREETMGDSQRILYIHVSMAWLGLVGFVAMAGAAAAYLVRRNLDWDHWSKSAGELGWLCSTLTLITGSLWARAAWGTWWTWEPRLLTAFILWALYSGYLMIRSAIADPHQRARLSAVVAILGVFDVPLVVMATRWFRGIHPVSPEMDPGMRSVLLLTVVSCTALFATLLACRRRQVQLEHAFVHLGNSCNHR